MYNVTAGFKNMKTNFLQQYEWSINEIIKYQIKGEIETCILLINIIFMLFILLQVVAQGA